MTVTSAMADQVINDDLIVTFSECIGNDCVNGESFGFDTLRLKENNLRIKFQDTSNSASFPTNDWQLTANDSSNGGPEQVFHRRHRWWPDALHHRGRCAQAFPVRG